MKNVKGNIIVVLFISLLFLLSCKSDTQFEKYPDFTKNKVDISDKVKKLETDLLLGQSKLKIVGDYLLVCDIFSLDEGFIFFDKKTLKYVGKGGRKGQGPGEIIRYKNVKVIPNEQDRNSFYVFDYSQVLLYKYNVDSLLNDKLYRPKKVLGFKNSGIVSNFTALNDSMFVGLGLYATSSSSFIAGIVKVDVNKKKVDEFGYNHPKVKEFGGGNTHSFFVGSKGKNRYVRAYLNQDLMTICDIEGNLVCDVYGAKWDGRKQKKFKIEYFNDVELCHNYIVAAYNGGKSTILGENKVPRGTYAQKFLVFDLDGNYLKTLDVGEEIRFFCIDEDTNRLFLALRNRDELSYVDLNGILE